MAKKNRLWAAVSLLCLMAEFILCRFVLFPSHGMKSWPVILAAAGLIILFISLLFQKRVLTVTTVAGYIGGYAFAALFSTDGVDPGGGATNDLWIQWTLVYLLCIAAGIVIEAVLQKGHGKGKPG